MPDLYASPDEVRRDRLIALGWRPAGKTMAGGVQLWKRPDGILVEEAHAFRTLAEIDHQAEEASIVRVDHED